MTSGRLFLVANFEELLFGILVDRHPRVGVWRFWVIEEGGIQRLSGWDVD